MIKYVKFGNPRFSKTGKTHVWPVKSREKFDIGEIRWYGLWRCYAFFPLPDTMYEKDCLRTIATFCERRSTEARRRWQLRRVKK